jgi:hypothetical protein
MREMEKCFMVTRVSRWKARNSSSGVSASCGDGIAPHERTRFRVAPVRLFGEIVGPGMLFDCPRRVAVFYF